MPRLSNQPCPDCGQDTLHRAMTCTVCGHINLTPSEARKLARTKISYSRRVRHWNGQGHVNVEQQRTIDAAKRAANSTFVTAPTGTQSVFGKGRGIPRT